VQSAAEIKSTIFSCITDFQGDRLVKELLCNWRSVGRLVSQSVRPSVLVLSQSGTHFGCSEDSCGFVRRGHLPDEGTGMFGLATLNGRHACKVNCVVSFFPT
jgi:hypothetical protein